jgi:hypothetical protein
MAKKLKRRSVAAVIAIAVMLLTLFASGGAKLSALRNEAEQVFYSGVRGDGLSIFGDLNTRLDCAYNMTIVARRNGGEGTAEVDGVQSAYDRLAQAMNAKASQSSLAALNRELTNAVETLYRKMEGYALSDTDETLVARQYRNFLSANDTISHDGYNMHAAEFNQTRSAFPANIIALLTGVTPLDYFR